MYRIEERFKDGLPLCACVNCINAMYLLNGKDNLKRNEYECGDCLSPVNSHKYKTYNNVKYIKRQFLAYKNFIPFPEIEEISKDFFSEEDFKI